MTCCRLATPLVCLALATPLVIAAARQNAAPAQKPVLAPNPPAVSLFDGSTLNGWRGFKRPDTVGSRWSVKDGTLALSPEMAKSGRDIITTDTYDLFDLTWEWKITPGGNSGVKYFVLEDRDSAIGHEYQIIDDEKHADAKVGTHRQTAALYDVLAPQQSPVKLGIKKPAGEWNTSRIRVAPSRVVPGGTRVYHYLNNVRILEYELNSSELNAAIEKSKFKGIERFGKLQKGHILLQDHNDQVWYRNIKISRIPSQS